MNVHSNIILNNQKLETTQMFKLWMDNQNLGYPYNGMLFHNKKEQSSDICYNMDEPHKYYITWKKPDTKDDKVYDSFYNKCSKEPNV